VNISDYFLKVKEMSKCGIAESKGISVFQVFEQILSNSPPEKLYQSIPLW
jgi:hypothetical protein